MYVLAHEQMWSRADFVPGTATDDAYYFIPPVTWLSPQLLPSIRHGGFLEVEPTPTAVGLPLPPPRAFDPLYMCARWEPKSFGEVFCTDIPNRQERRQHVTAVTPKTSRPALISLFCTHQHFWGITRNLNLVSNEKRRWPARNHTSPADSPPPPSHLNA